MTGNIPYIFREQTENLLSCFNEAIQKPESNPLLFNVWGIGGVGKTTLLNKLSEQHPEIAFARVYFGTTPDIATPLKLMANLYRQLPAIDDWGKETEIFTTLYQQYEETLRQLKEPDKKESETQATERKEYIKKLVGGLAKTYSKAKNPGYEEPVGLIFEGSIELVYWLGKQKITKKDKELQALMLEPIPKLTEAFVAGLIAKSANQPIVLLLDTYEKTDREVDDWLWQYLIANPKLKLHPIRIVVAGRNNLLKQESWRKLQQDSSLVYDLEIEKFNLEQTQTYLEELGIAEVEQIYQVAKGLPYYLNWIREQQEKGKTLDFSQGNQEITKLLLQGLNRQQEQIIQLAACCRWFDRALIEDLITSPSFKIANVVEPQIDYFEWLQQLDFVELVQYTYRLDDVARDVFRLSLWQEDREKFCLVNKLLADYFEQKANQEVPADSSPRLQYENDEWRGYTAEFLYHYLFTKQPDSEQQFLSYLFTSCYFQATEVVSTPFTAITAEAEVENHQLLSSTIKRLLQAIQPIFVFEFRVFEEQQLADQINQFVEMFYSEKYFSSENLNTVIEKFNLGDEINKLYIEKKIKIDSEQLDFKRKYFILYLQNHYVEKAKTEIKPTLEYCFNHIESLSGLAKFVALIYKAKNCVQSQQLLCLKRAQDQAETILLQSDTEFSSGLFLWDLGHSFFEFKHYEEAIASYDRAIEIKPDNDSAWYNRGIALDDLGRLDEAIESFDRAIEIKPDNDSAWNNRSSALGNLGKFEDVVTSCDQALEINPGNDSAWYNRGIALKDLGKYEEAVASFDCAIKINPDDNLAWNDRGIALGNLGKYEEAVASYNRALEINYESNLVWNNRGAALGNLGKYEEAVASYDRAIEINPESDFVWNNRGITLGNLGKYEEAVASFDCAIKINPDNDSAWHDRGVALGDLGKFEDAVTSYDRAIEINPENDLAWNNRGIDLDNLGKYEDAVTSYNRALEINPNKDSTWNNRGIALDNLGKYEDAVTSYNRALEINLDNNLAWYSRGIALCKLGKYEDAVASYDRALEINSEDYLIWLLHSWVLIKLERYSEALESCDRALKLGGENSIIYFNRAIALLALNQWDKGINSLKDVLNLFANEEIPDLVDMELIVENLLNQKQDRDVWKTRIATLLEIFDRHQVTFVLEQAIVKTIPTLMPEMISDKAAQTWLETWQELTGDRPEFQIPLRLLKTAVGYKISKGDRRVLLQLAMEERDLLEPLLEAES